MKSLQPAEADLTPREVVAALDRYIVGQAAAKRAVAIALRNRWRRSRVESALRDEISPKNIILIGATGVGKTEIARRLARLAQAPFLKVEASKFTEVGYVGRDVESIVRDLVEASVQLVRAEALAQVTQEAEEQAEERVLDLLLPRPKFERGREGTEPPAEDKSRARLRAMLRDHALDDRELEVEAQERPPAQVQLLPHMGPEDMGQQLQEMLGQVMGRRTRKRKVKVPEALVLLAREEAEKLIDPDAVHKEAVRRAEQSGIVFLDEIDKIARREGASHSPDISREGVQRDLLPLIEGASVSTKYGPVRTDHVLFIAAGAFHVSRVSDLIPEMQGRFPIRVELDALGETELLRILREPQNALPVQYRALLATEGVTLEFSDGGLEALAKVAAAANSHSENIGARRLHTVMERLLEDISFTAPEQAASTCHVDAAMVEARLGPSREGDDLSRYIL